MNTLRLRRADARSSWPLLVPLLLLVAWMLIPVVQVLVYAAEHGDTITGASGYDTFDQMAYLAWIRDEGSHLLASDLWHIGPTAHDYLHPMYLISGLLWRAGVSLQVAYLIWKPIGLIVLFVGCAWYVRHLLPGRPGQQAAALTLALFYITPALQLARWLGRLSALHRLQLLTAVYDSDSALNLWGFEHAAITIGAMPVFLICAERILHRGGRAARGSVVAAAIAGGLAAWLQPWQGVTLLIIVAAMVVLVAPRRRYVSLAIPVVATVVPLLYGEALTHYDPVWRAFQHKTLVSSTTGPWWALALGFAPLVVFALAGVRRPRDDRTWMLLLWVPAVLIVYLFVPQFPPHALKGVTLPLAILAVLGSERAARAIRRRVPMPATLAATVAVLAIAFFTVPGAIAQVTDAVAYTGDTAAGQLQRQLVVLTPDQEAATRYLDRVQRPGPVLAPWYPSMSLPAYTGREVFAGHPMWQPVTNVALANAFFSAASTGAERRTILRRSGVRFVVRECGQPAAIDASIAALVRPVARFGCVRVLRVSGP